MKKATLQTDGTWLVETMSSSEETEINNYTAIGNTLKAAEAAAETQKATDKAAATTKLKALGLTDAEIAALSG